MYRVPAPAHLAKFVFRYEGRETVIRPKLDIKLVQWLNDHAGDGWDAELYEGVAEDRCPAQSAAPSTAIVINVVDRYETPDGSQQPVVAFVRKKHADAFAAAWGDR